MSEQKTKKPQESKTLVFNALTLTTVALTAIADHQIILDNPLLVGAVAVISSLVNLGLRLVTKDAIAR